MSETPQQPDERHTAWEFFVETSLELLHGKQLMSLTSDDFGAEILKHFPNLTELSPHIHRTIKAHNEQLATDNTENRAHKMAMLLHRLDYLARTSSQEH